MRSVPNPGTPGKSRLACCAAGGGVFLLRVPFSPTGCCMTVLAQWLPSGEAMLCVFHTGATGTCHDLRRTCLNNWVAPGLSLHEVKELAGHTGIDTTERFYLAIRKDVVDRARAASGASRKGHSVARLLRAPEESDKNEELP